VQTVEPILIAKEAVRDSVVVQKRLLRAALASLASLLILLCYLTIAAPHVPALGLPTAFSGVRQTDYNSPFIVIASGIGLIASPRRSTLVTAAAVALLLIAAVDLAVRATSGRTRTLEPGRVMPASALAFVDILHLALRSLPVRVAPGSPPWSGSAAEPPAGIRCQGPVGPRLGTLHCRDLRSEKGTTP
jgi:hypothetical protein